MAEDPSPESITLSLSALLQMLSQCTEDSSGVKVKSWVRDQRIKQIQGSPPLPSFLQLVEKLARARARTHTLPPDSLADYCYSFRSINLGCPCTEVGGRQTSVRTVTALTAELKIG